MFTTYQFSTGLVSLQPGTVAISAGKTFTLVATEGYPYQANVPVWFSNATAYSTLTSQPTKSLSTITGTTGATYTDGSVTITVAANTGIAIMVVTAPTSATAASSSTSFTARQVLFILSYPATNPGPFLSNSTAVTSGTISTKASTIASLVVTAYFTTATTIVGASPSAVIPYGGSKTTATTTYGLTTNIAASKALFLDAAAADAFGNPVTVSGVTQVTFVASSGTLSTPVANIPQSGEDVASFNFGTSTAVLLSAPSGIGTVITITASAAGPSGVISGSDTVTVVTSIPSLTLQSSVPTTVTSGVPVTFSGVVNATLGAFGVTIVRIEYTVNWVALATPTTVQINANHAGWTFATTLSATKSSAVNITAVDSASNVFTIVVQVPPVPTGLTFTNSTDLKQITFGPSPAINATFTNNYAGSLTVIMLGNVYNSAGAVIAQSTATATAAAGQTVFGILVPTSLAHGTYKVTVTVYSQAFVTLSQVETVSFTV